MRRILFFLVILILYVIIAIRVYHRSTDSDFLSTYQTAKRISADQPIYDANEGMHGLMWSPFYAVLTIPLAKFSAPVAAVIFFTFSFAATFIALFFLLQMYPLISIRYVLLALLLSGRFILDNWLYGQINSFILLAIVLFMHFGYNFKYLPAHIFVILAASIKVFPLAFLPCFFKQYFKKPYFAFWKSFSGALIGLLILFVLPWIIFGFGQTVQEYKNWFLMLSTAFGRMPLDHTGNQSITGFITRTYGYNESNISLASWISIGLSLMIIYLAIGRQLVKRFALLTIACILLSPIVWKHTLMLLIIPNMYIAYSMERKPLSRFTPLQIFFLALYVLLTVFTSNSIIGNVSQIAMSHSVLLWAVIAQLMFIALDNDYNLRNNIKTKF